MAYFFVIFQNIIFEIFRDNCWLYFWFYKLISNLIDEQYIKWNISPVWHVIFSYSFVKCIVNVWSRLGPKSRDFKSGTCNITVLMFEHYMDQKWCTRIHSCTAIPDLKSRLFAPSLLIFHLIHLISLISFWDFFLFSPEF